MAIDNLTKDVLAGLEKKYFELKNRWNEAKRNLLDQDQSSFLSEYSAKETNSDEIIISFCDLEFIISFTHNFRVGAINYLISEPYGKEEEYRLLKQVKFDNYGNINENDEKSLTSRYNEIHFKVLHQQVCILISEKEL